MLNVGQLNEGVVLDHIEAGKSMSIYHHLKLDQLDCCVAIIKNARSNKMGKKDIIKIEGNLNIDLNVLGVLDHKITIPSAKLGNNCCTSSGSGKGPWYPCPTMPISGYGSTINNLRSRLRCAVLSDSRRSPSR